MMRILRPFIFGVLLVVLIAPLFIRSANTMSLSINLSRRFESPSLSAPFGRDHHGSDLLGRVAVGTQQSLMIGMIVVLVSGAIGLIIGGWSGYRGGVTDSFFLGFTEVLLSVPGVLLSMVLTLLMEPSVLNLCFALTVTSWIGTARIVRSEVLRLRTQEFVEAARALGATEARILVVHLFPMVVPLLVVTALSQLPGVILSESALSYLGLGLPLDQPSLGQMIAQGRKYFIEAPHEVIFPGLAVVFIVFCFQILASQSSPKYKSRIGNPS